MRIRSMRGLFSPFTMRRDDPHALSSVQDASSAARLVYILNSTPVKPFMGRFLRYEPARAFRTLLISYRYVR